MRYSTLGFELAVGVGVCVMAGVKLDDATASTFPYFTLLGALLAFLFVIVRLFRLAGNDTNADTHDKQQNDRKR